MDTAGATGATSGLTTNGIVLTGRLERMRMIDTDNVLKALGVFNDREHGDPHFLNGIETAREIVEQAPTIDAAPVRHGRWIGWHHHWAWLVCDQCNEKMLVRKSNHGYIQTFPHNFCPNCGAKMRDGD